MLWRLVNQQAKQIAELQDEIALQDEEDAKLKKQVKDLRAQVAGTKPHASFAPYDTGNPYEGNTTTAKPSQLSAKIPDPPILTDGKDPPYKHWDFQMNNKLIGNAD
ncbi:hypothetical protein K469DRAFT_688393 [Zopfia rhizophila CBS 207.26]|uniref:Uncharacterized protein n=1 Tax=Zopfia rhizophila CBS 207.26 TaxID=1314779 RepID=A0A6A6E4F7_9PEZI|nr:hypothetical protein K469DRAFT_688393 [Zopfia rhizophila CBS 207.26]